MGVLAKQGETEQSVIVRNTQEGDIFFIFVVVVVLCVNSDMFTIHILRKQVVTVGVNQFHFLFYGTRFSLIYYSHIFINAKYK